MLNLARGAYRYSPYPIGIFPDVLPTDTYEALVREWPDTDLFRYMPKLGNKYSLSEVNNPDQYKSFIRSNPVWANVYKEFKSDKFVKRIIAHLVDNNIDLCLGSYRVSKTHELSGPKDKIEAAFGKLLRVLGGDSSRTLTTRFEFSMLPLSGGHIKPHTDSPQKLITLVFSMQKPGEWDDSWGGGH